MPRGARLIEENGTYHITSRGNNKRRLFRWRHEFKSFKRLMLFYKNKYNILIYHYVVMVNHIHLCIKATKDADISKFMQGLQLAYFNYHNKRTGYVGHLFQGRFFSNIIAHDNYLLASSLYIERNPVMAGSVKNPEDYQWSSYRHYAFGEKDPLIDTNPFYYDLGKTDEKRQKYYRELMYNSIQEVKQKNFCVTL